MIETVSQNNVKNSYGIPLRNEIKKTSSFISKSLRFQTDKNNISPGPCAYEYKQISTDFHINVERQTSPIKKQYQWILQNNNRMPYLNMQDNRTLGPGSYNITTLKTHKYNSSWSKSTRFNGLNNAHSLVGPGAYEYDSVKSTKSSASSAFKSRVPKGFSQIIQIDLPKNQTQSNALQDSYINNPEDSKIQNNRKITMNQKLMSAFASKIQRFDKIKKVALGPGSYEVDIQKNPKDNLPKIITIREPSNPSPKQHQRPTPGPGQYQIKKTLIQQINHIGNTALAEKAQRFINKKKQKSPGPGHYNRNKYVYITDSLKNPQNKPSFLTTGLRSSPISDQEIPFGTYNVDIYNLEYKIKKKKEHLQKLKVMEVQIPAFNSKQKR